MWLLHGHDGVVEGVGALIGMALDLDADEDGKTEPDPVAPEHGAIGFDIPLALQPLYPAQAGRR
jgi:hypothetical protein